MNLGLFAGDLDLGAKVAGLAVNLDAVVKVLFESGSIEDLVFDWLPAVNSELGDGLLGGLLSDLLW